MYDVIVIGAGFAGSVFARKMADSGKSVLVIEKRAQIGGNVYDEYSGGILIQKYGPHLFHTSNKKVLDFLQEFSDWYQYEHHVLGKINGRLVPIPFNFTSIDMLFPEQEAFSLKKKLLLHFSENDRVSVFNLMEHDEDSIKHLGAFIYENVFLHYTAKQWGIPVELVDKSTLNRVPVTIGYDAKYFQDSYQMMPKNGFTALVREMLNHRNIMVKLKTGAKEKITLENSGKRIMFENKIFSGILFFTGAIDEFLDYKHGTLPYRSINMVFENINQEWYQPNSVINYPNEEDFTRITEFKYLTPPHPTIPMGILGNTVL